MKWTVELTGYCKTLDLLSLVFNYELSIFKEKDIYLLESKHINSIDDHEIAINEVELLLLRINALAKICLGISENIDYNCIYYFDEKGNKRSFLKPIICEVAIKCEVGIKTTRSDGTIELYNPAVKIKDWIEVAYENDSAKKILYLISHDFSSWVGLYKIIDVLDKDEKYSAVKPGGKYYNDIKAIKRTANSYQITKEKGRHGYDDPKPPEKPVELIYAHNIIKNVLIEWFDEKKMLVSHKVG